MYQLTQFTAIMDLTIVSRNKDNLKIFTIQELFDEVERLPLATKWELLHHLLHSMEQTQNVASPQTDWHQFLRETYGSLSATPLERWSQGDYEERELLE